jgi:hypothetical protein
MLLPELKRITIDLIKEYPKHKGQLTEYYYLAESETEEDGKEEHECELAYRDMMDLVKH